MRKICIAILLVPALAWAQKTADEWYKEGENQYNLGNFDKAVDAFKQGFALETNDSKKAAYLYNVAQSYRQENDCKNALFFYKRFLALKGNDTTKPLSAKTRKDVEERITELEACVQQATSISKKPPNNNIAPDGDGDGDGKTPASDTHKDPPRKDPAHKNVAAVTTHGDGDGDGDGDEGEPKPKRSTRPHLIVARLTGGATKVSAGDNPVPVQATFALTAGYPIPINDKLMIDAGAAFTFTPVPYTIAARQGMPEASKTASLIAVLANAGATYQVAPKISVRGDLGLGALLFGGVSESVFTAGAPTSGALTMFHVRAAISGEYAITPNIQLTLPSIAFSYSPPKDGLAADIKSITSFDFMLGLGYRM
jgi:tetratricopeptide (TPR) repeat protein